MSDKQSIGVLKKAANALRFVATRTARHSASLCVYFIYQPKVPDNMVERLNAMRDC